MKIDICSHVMPKKFKEALLKKTKNKQINSLDFVEQNRVLYDMELRLRLLNRYSELTEVLVPMPAPLESFVSLEDACDLAKLNNDETAELVEKYPDKFLAAVAILPQNDIDAAQKELERVVTKLGMRGLFCTQMSMMNLWTYQSSDLCLLKWQSMTCRYSFIHLIYLLIVHLFPKISRWRIRIILITWSQKPFRDLRILPSQ